MFLFFIIIIIIVMNVLYMPIASSFVVLIMTYGTLVLFEGDVIGPSDLLYFADLCAGPGGFSEYVLWRKGWQAKGFGFTLKGTGIVDLYLSWCLYNNNNNHNHNHKYFIYIAVYPKALYCCTPNY